MFVRFTFAVRLIPFLEVINNEHEHLPSFLFVFVCLFFIFLSFYRSQRDFQESLALNTLNIDARPEFASRNGTGIERLRTEPLVQQEGVYTALSPESMTVIILTTKLEFLNMSLIQKGTKGCAIHYTSFFQFFSCFSLFSACAPFPALILLL